jgi:lipoate-protein ligase A
MTPVGARLFARLALIGDPIPRDAAFNMAADEQLLASAGSGPLLRLYRWERPAISIGYFIPFADARAAFPDREIVRRWTGGGLVEHFDDFTYSLLVPSEEPLARLAARDAYGQIHLAIAQALKEAGLETAPLALSHAPASPAGGACFANPAPRDLLAGGRKIGGAAQRRTRSGLLHQGSVLLPGAAPGWREKLGEALPGTLAEFPAPRTFSLADAEASQQLANAKYATAAWREKF